MASKKIVEIPGPILKELRRSLNIPKGVIATKLKIEETTLNEWEGSGVTISVARARKIAKVFGGRHWTTLLLDKIPDKKNLSKNYRMLLDSNVDLSTDSLLAFRKAERILYLADSIDGRKSKWGEIKSLKLNSRLKIRHQFLERVKSWLEVSSEEIRKLKNDYEALDLWSERIESKGIYISQLSMPRDELSAFALSDKKRVVIVLNNKDTVKRRIFSLLHELVHVLLTKSDTFDIFDGTYQEDRVEVLCNRLAGSLLLPSSVLKTFLSSMTIDTNSAIEALSNRYKVSKQVVIRRMYDVGLMGKVEFEKTNEELEEAYLSYSKRKVDGFIPPKGFYEKKIIRENSTAFTFDIFEAHRHNKISYREVGELLGVKPKYVYSIADLLRYA